MQSDLEDTITMSAGRCWPFVTFTMSPTATLWPGWNSARVCESKQERRRKFRQRVRGNKRGMGEESDRERKQ